MVALIIPLLQLIQDNGTPTVTTTNVVYVLISHGKNAIGAWGMNGGSARITTGTPAMGTNETENTDFTSDAIYTDSSMLDHSEAGVNYFDDVVLWKKGTQLQYGKQN